MKEEKANEIIKKILSRTTSEGELEAARRELEKSPLLQKELGDQISMDALLRYRLGEDRPTPGLAQKIVSRIETSGGRTSRKRSSTRIARITAPPRGRFLWLKTAACLAACLVVTVGLYMALNQPPPLPEDRQPPPLSEDRQPPRLPEDRSGMGSIARVIGDVHIRRGGQRLPVSNISRVRLEARDVLVTGPKSVCKVQLNDGSVIALNKKTEMGMLVSEKGGKTALLERGEIYLDVGRQIVPLAVASPGEFEITVLGTRLFVSRSPLRASRRIKPGSMVLDTVSVAVIEGEARVSSMQGSGSVSVYIGKGERARFIKGKSLINVETAKIPRSAYNILDSLDIDTADMRKLDSRGDDHRTANMPRLDQYMVRDSGIWRIDRRGKDTVITQEDPIGGKGQIIFKQEHQNAEFSFDFRVLKQSARDSIIHPYLEFRRSDKPGLSVGGAIPCPGMALKAGSHGRHKMRFSIDSKGKLTVERHEYEPHKDRSGFITPENPKVFKREGWKACRVGIRTNNCVAEITNLRLVDTADVITTRAGKRYRIGDVILEDNFTQGLGNWAFNIFDGQQKLETWNRNLEDITDTCPFVRIEKMRKDSGTICAMRLDSIDTQGNDFIARLRNPIAETAYVIDMDYWVESINSGVVVQYLFSQPQESIAVYEDSTHTKGQGISLKKWYRCRFAFFKIRDKTGKMITEKMSWLDGRFVLHKTYAPIWQHDVFFSRDVIFAVANLKVRKLIPVD